MIEIIIAIAVVVAPLIVAIIYSSIEDYNKVLESLRRSNAVKLKFSAFRDFYQMNPDSWLLHYSYVVNVRTEIECYFGRIDLLRYRLWKRDMQIGKENNISDKRRAQLLKSVQQDINNYVKQNKIDWAAHLTVWKDAYDNIKKG